MAEGVSRSDCMGKIALAFGAYPQRQALVLGA